jgi:hypothetical protein
MWGSRKALLSYVRMTPVCSNSERKRRVVLWGSATAVATFQACLARTGDKALVCAGHGNGASVGNAVSVLAVWSGGSGSFAREP